MDDELMQEGHPDEALDVVTYFRPKFGEVDAGDRSFRLHVKVTESCWRSGEQLNTLLRRQCVSLDGFLWGSQMRSQGFIIGERACPSVHSKQPVLAKHLH